MKIVEFLSDLRRKDIKIWVDGDKLRYSAPQGALTPHLRTKLVERKAEIIAFLLATNITLSPILPALRPENLPLSFAQQRLWFLDQLEPGTFAYNIPAIYRLTGLLDTRALEQSFNEIIRRHEVLRTTFRVIDDNPVQVIASTLTLSMPVIDLRHLPESEREAEAERLISVEQQWIFDLAHGPLLRVSLLRLAEAEHILSLVIHHIISDDWSMNILFKELSILYKAFSAGKAFFGEKASPLPELPLQYADFTLWQREWLQGQVRKVQLDYWKTQLAGSQAVLELPTDRPRPALQSYRGAKQAVYLSQELTEAITALSRREGTTLFMTLLAAFKVLLHRYTGQADIVVGTPIANRNRAEIEDLIGFFLNTLVLRSDLSDNLTFDDLLKQVRDTALGAYDHQDLPVEQLIETLQPERNFSHNPLFQILFVLQNVPDESPLALPEITSEQLSLKNETAKLDLSLYIQEKPEGLTALFEYNTDLFDHTTIQRMAGHFKTLLASIAAKPDTPISQLPLLTSVERYQLLLEWNATIADYPRDKCLHQLFEAQVAQTPKAVAVVFEDEQLTYADLNERANRVARYLQSLGVGPETCVGICLERSLNMVVGLLGILKAGGAYVPLDPAFPADRLLYMLADAQVSVLLTHTKLGLAQQLVNSLTKPLPHIVFLDKDWAAIEASAGPTGKSNVSSHVMPDNLAYVIYTSGSTSKPKGVQLPHQAVVNFLTSMSRQPGLTSQDTLLAVTTLSFDISVLELFLPLSIGAKVVVAGRETTLDGSRLAQCLTESGATVMQATPSTWRILVEAGWPGNPNLKVLCGGETLPTDLAAWLLEHTGYLWNMYGPTETTVWSTIARVKTANGPISIGRPIANTRIYILDDNLNPVPIGVAGELYIGGDGVARGYLNRPELTAEKFIPDPFSNKPQAIMYRTGDKARYLVNGNIEFLGRVDFQVKIRGFRVELGEIETVLAQHTVVRQAVVVVREDTPGQKRLVAYIVPDDEQIPTTGELRGFLQQKLPEYMIPSAFISLKTLPLTPNGKTDRRALPAPAKTRPELKQTFVSPRTETEKTVAKMWAKVLNLEWVGIHDNFFDLGGHSLLAAQVISQVRQIFQIELPLRSLFEAPTVAGLAERIGMIRWAMEDFQTPTGATMDKYEEFEL